MSVQADNPAVEGARARRMTEWVFRVRELGLIGVLLAADRGHGIPSRASSTRRTLRDIRSTSRSSPSSPSARRSS